MDHVIIEESPSFIISVFGSLLDCDRSDSQTSCSKGCVMKAQVISFHCVLKNKLGQVLSSSFNQGVLTASEPSSTPLKGLTLGLQDIQTGERRQIFVPADQAYGFYDLAKVKQIPLEDFPRAPMLGEGLRLPGESLSFRVIEIKNGSVTLDANHPLAGQDLIFEVEAVDTRPATADDLPVQMESPQMTTFH